jgi:antitoxin component YwqK of YwqJK toxin-antitoxin module
MKNAFLMFVLLCLGSVAHAQQSTPAANGTMPDLVRDRDSTTFKNILPGKNGFTRIYQVADPDVSFISSASKTRIGLPGSVLMCEEGTLVNGQRNGLFTTYVTDNTDHHKRYKIHEQNFKNNLLDGHWKAYDLGGTLKYDMMFTQGRQSGFSVYYGPDGKTVTETCQFANDSMAVMTKFEDGKKQQVQTLVNGIKNGTGTVYYANGSIMSTAIFLNGQFNDTLKYYYPNGVLWTEEIFKNGLDWTVLNNFDSTSKTRDAGTLKNGNGTRILYTEEGEVRQVVTYLNGMVH